jgi:hypothetical protein
MRVRQQLQQVHLAVYLHETHCKPWQLGARGLLLSPWQKYTVGRIARMADVVFTSNQVWQTRILRDYHVEPKKIVLLPIGSNIPNLALSAAARLKLRRSLNWGEEETVAVTFGSYGSQLSALERFKHLLLKGLSQKALDRVICLGGGQPAIPPEFARWRECFANSGSLQVVGPRPGHEVGAILACCDFAFTATPRNVLEKSGAFMAFAMAGLAVLAFDNSRDEAITGDHLPVLPAKGWDWRKARSPQVAIVRKAIRQHAQCNYRWETIARHALKRLGYLTPRASNYESTIAMLDTGS